MAKELIETDIDVLEPKEQEYSLSGGDFFKQHPEKLLAEPYEASGRFGTVTKYKPKAGKKAIDVLKDIETPVFIAHGITDISAGASVIIPDVEKSIPTPEAGDNRRKAIEDSEQGVVKRARSKKKELMDFEEPAAKPTIPFEDILRTYNKDLSQDEIKAFLWYMHSQGNTYKGKWLNILNPTLLSQEQESAYINNWVKSGILFYYKGELLPAFIYFSENLYDRKAIFDQDKDSIISIYGAETARVHENKLNEAFGEIYNNRLKLDNPDVEKRLHLKPYGEFTNSVQVKNWNIDNQSGDPLDFLVVTKSDGSINWYSTKTSLSTWRDTKKQTLSIADAFRWWLKYDSERPNIPYNFSWIDIYKYYLDKKTVKNIDPTVLARNRALAKEIGDKLFGKFLAEIILENDRVKIETEWNMKFNSDRGLRTDKIPIAFECALNYPGNEPVEIRAEKREAVAFASIRGSSLNAYQVGVGKANLMTSNILTPKGWVKMRDIKPEMEVIGKNGKPTKVLQIFPQGELPAYRVTFSDGAYTEVTGDHLWNVQNIWDRTYTGKWRTLPTVELAKKLYNVRNDRIYSIPMVEPVQFEHKDVPIDPYLVGALIGDGGLTSDVSFSNPEIEVQNKIRDIVESYGLYFSPEKGQPEKDFRITRGKSPKDKNVILDALRDLGLMGKKSIDKFIPDLYLYNSVDVRLALLQGIMDTDGYVNKNGHCTQICTSSKRLAESIIELIRSFGGTVNENIKHPKYTYKGELKEGHEAYVLTIRLPNGVIPFTTKKHLDKYKPKTKYQPIRFINSIEPIGKHEAQCILVEDKEHLYVCDEYIVTHNTWAAILTMAQFLEAGHCKRPFLVVPNQVYKQFFSEMKGILPHRKINDLYNLSQDYIDKLLDENGKVQMVEEGTISMLTYEGFEQIGFKEETAQNLMVQLEDALTQIQSVEAYNESKSAEKEAERKRMKLEGLIGKALQKTKTNIEDLGFDFVCFDEAHALKNIFSQVKGKPKAGDDDDEEEKGREKRGKKMYEISGSSSTRGIKAYCLCSYIQLANRGRNILLLTATPFTNSPLEVYSMLSLVAYQHLKQIGLANINDFFDNYCQVSYELVINSKLQPIRKQVFKSFDNLQSLQKLVYRYMLHKEAGKADANGNIIALVRPDKWVLPYKGRFNSKNEFIGAKPDEIVDTVLPLTDEQKTFMEEIVQYVEGKISYDGLQNRGQARVDIANLTGDEDEETKQAAEEALLDEGSMDDDEKAGVKTLRGVNFARSVALSPYLYPFSGLGEPDYKNYVEKSPKLKYTMGCIESVKKWHESKKEAISGQVIYMDRGKNYFELLKDYLVKEIGFKPHEIGIVRSGKEGTAKNKDFVKNGFNGLKFNEATKSFSDLKDDERIKIIIGTSSIKEGMNLQRYATVLYNCNVDWNPTDEIQLEGRVWRQGNSFSNVRIVIPMMSDSMDIFMFQKLEEKTERINSIWNHDGKSNVLKVEEIDPKEQKLALVTDPKVIAQLETEDEQSKIEEESSVISSNVEMAENIEGFFDKRDKFERELSRILAVLEPKKEYPSIDVMVKDFEKHYTKQQEKSTYSNVRKQIQEQMRTHFKSKYDNMFLDYEFALTKSWEYGNMKAAVAQLKKAKKTFFERFEIADNKEALRLFVEDQEAKKERMQEDVKRLQSEDYIEERAKEIERERKAKKIKFVPVAERVKEFQKLNYLLGLRNEQAMYEAEEWVETEITGCPPVSKDGKPDVSPEGIKKLEACLERIPQTKDMNTDETGQYTEKRLKLHKVIKGKLRAGLSCKTEREKPIAILMSGVPGAGKSSFVKKYLPNLEKEKIFKIDADEVRTMLPEYKGWNSKATHKETQDIYKGLLQDVSDGKPCRFDILWDGTMNRAENYLPLIGDLQKLGYQIYMINVKVPWDVSRKRTLDRYVKASGDGKYGRYVPMAVVDEANKNGGKAFEDLKHKADGYMVVDGVTTQIVERGGTDILADRGYFDHEPTEKDAKIKKAKAIAIAQKQKIEILKLKAA